MLLAQHVVALDVVEAILAPTGMRALKKRRLCHRHLLVVAQRIVFKSFRSSSRRA
jgi:hypothetical protein